jgi:hypothetical protein
MLGFAGWMGARQSPADAEANSPWQRRLVVALLWFAAGLALALALARFTTVLLYHPFR